MDALYQLVHVFGQCFSHYMYMLCSRYYCSIYTSALLPIVRVYMVEHVHAERRGWRRTQHKAPTPLLCVEFCVCVMTYCGLGNEMVLLLQGLHNTKI